MCIDFKFQFPAGLDRGASRDSSIRVASPAWLVQVKRLKTLASPLPTPHDFPDHGEGHRTRLYPTVIYKPRRKLPFKCIELSLGCEGDAKTWVLGEFFRALCDAYTFISLMQYYLIHCLHLQHTATKSPSVEEPQF